jgi:hypothetical protein
MPDLRHSQQSLDLDETDGWMECESCHNAVQILEYAKTRRVPVYQMARLQSPRSVEQEKIEGEWRCWRIGRFTLGIAQTVRRR